MGEHTIKVSDDTYDKVKTLSETGDRTQLDTVEDLLSVGLEGLGKVAEAVEHLEKDAGIEEQQVNGVVYFCEACRYPLDPREELAECPGCQTKLSWAENGKPGAGLGVIGWGLIGLALLISLGAKRRA
ncbi:hypothetical protein ES703_19816 [subsurface metagenome]